MAKNLIGLAKGGVKKPITVAKKPVVKKIEEKKLTAAEERDIKAKETVQKLLADSPIVTLDKKDDLLELDTPDVQPKEVDLEWLEEQVSLLSEQNEHLKSELVLVKEDYQRLFNERGGVGTPDSGTKISVIELFNELQNNHLKLGTDPQSGVGNFRIYCPGFLNRMIKFFPFLEEIKRY